MTARVLQVMAQSAGGIARHVAGITAGLDGDGFDIDVAGPRDLSVAMPKPVIPLEIPAGLVGHGSPTRELARLIEAGGYDVVHAHGLRAGIDAARAAGKTRATAIVTVHNLVRPEVVGKLKAAIQKPAERLVVRLSDRILAVSRDIAAELSTSVSNDLAMKIEVLHLGIGEAPIPARSAHAVRSELGLAEGEPLVVTASRLSEQKALHVMIEAVAGTRAALAILGRGPLEGALRDLVATLGLERRVRFLGFRDDVSDFIAAADLFCLSSVWEGVPLAAMEAVQLGTPVVATDVGGTGELIEDRVSGRLVPANDARALRDTLNEVLSSERDRGRYVEAARDSLAARFSTVGMLARLRELYGSGTR